MCLKSFFLFFFFYGVSHGEYYCHYNHTNPKKVLVPRTIGARRLDVDNNNYYNNTRVIGRVSIKFHIKIPTEI